MLKSHNATTKRFRVTKAGKVIKKKTGQAHFNARERGVTTRMKRRAVNLGKQYHRTVKTLISA